MPCSRRAPPVRRRRVILCCPPISPSCQTMLRGLVTITGPRAAPPVTASWTIHATGVLREGGRPVAIVEIATPRRPARDRRSAPPSTASTRRLLAGAGQVTPQNEQGEYYLTDVIGILRREDRRIEAVIAADARECSASTIAASSPARHRAAQPHPRSAHGRGCHHPRSRHPMVTTRSRRARHCALSGRDARGRTRIGAECVIGTARRSPRAAWATDPREAYCVLWRRWWRKGQLGPSAICARSRTWGRTPNRELRGAEEVEDRPRRQGAASLLRGRRPGGSGANLGAGTSPATTTASTSTRR